MVVQQPGMIDQRLQDQRLAAGDRAALAAHDRAQCKLGARRLIGPAVDGLAAGGRLPAAARLESACGAGRERTARRKAPARFATEASRAAAIAAAAVAAAPALRRECPLQALPEIL